MPAIRLPTLHASFSKSDKALSQLATAKQIADMTYLFDENSMGLLAYQDQARICSLDHVKIGERPVERIELTFATSIRPNCEISSWKDEAKVS
jgi:hypothetical protein